jgi:hypothetical protein
MKFSCPAFVVMVLLSLTSGVIATADQPARARDQLQYIRLSKDGQEVAQSLDVAVVSFVSADGALQVDLVGAIHVADATYFRRLNKRFLGYEAVLYELVAPEGTRIPRGGVEASGPVGMLQGGMTAALGLAYQLNEIDYTKSNFVHADMTPEEFSKSMKEREESVGKMFFRAIGHAMAKQSTATGGNRDLRMFKSMFSENREWELKLLMAEQFADLNGAMSIYEGRNGSTLITERNKKALSVLKQQLAIGKKKLAIFYGAGHMQDMEQRLTEEFNLTRKQVDWFVAWDLSEDSIPARAGTND